MPIRPENKARYPKDWKAISHRIRFDRANGMCECLGECGRGHTERCPNIHGHENAITGSLVVLTTAHLNHTPEDCRDENLKAMCQGCHLHYDRAHHAETRAATKRAELELTMASLFDVRAESTGPVAMSGKVEDEAPAMCPASGGATHPVAEDR